MHDFDVTFRTVAGVRPHEIEIQLHIMKTIATALALVSFLLPMAVTAEPPKADPFEEGMRQAFTDYKKGDIEAVTANLRKLLKLMEERDAEKVGETLPAELNGWRGGRVKHDDLGTVGGGVSVSRSYLSGRSDITVKVMKDAPAIKQLLPLLTNDELIRISNRKTYRISGETAIMDGGRKMQMVIDERIFVELVAGGEAGEKDLVSVARKLDLRALAKMK